MKPRTSLIIAFAAGLALWIPAIRDRWQASPPESRPRIRPGLVSASPQKETRFVLPWESRLQQALELPDAQAQAELTDLLEAWAEKDGNAALTWTMDHLDSKSRALMIPAVLAQWAWHDPQGIRDWYARTKEDPVWFVDPDSGWCREEYFAKTLATLDPAMGAEFWVRDFGKSGAKVTGAKWFKGVDPTREIVKAVRSGSDCRRVLEILDEARKSHPFLQENDFEPIVECWKGFDPGAARQWEQEHPGSQEK